MGNKLVESPDTLRRKFYELETSQDVADLLDVEYKKLIYHLEKVPEEEKYRVFYIRKKSGGMRTITAPISAIKIIQQKLNQVLQLIYIPRKSTHGFTFNKSIVSNAMVHAGSSSNKYVLNLDLRNFFPTIDFDRVVQLFISNPYHFDYDVAKTLAKICCFENTLPQGAPTSPIISNMICIDLDKQLEKLAKQCGSNYTRYADDITFSMQSSSIEDLPKELIKLNKSTLELSETLTNIITENGFEINFKKVRLQTSSQRQEVTGLTVNGEKPNVKRSFVRQIRAMLHAWKTFGLEAAEQEYIQRYNLKQQNPWYQPPAFKKVVLGKINFLRMVRGKNDAIYAKFINEFKLLNDKAQTLSTDRIELTPVTPAETDNNNNYAPSRFRLNLRQINDQTFHVDLESPDGETYAESKLPYTNEELTAILKILPHEYAQDANLTSRQHEILAKLGFLEGHQQIFKPGWDNTIGRDLFNALFPDEIGTVLKGNLYQLSYPKKSLEVILKLYPKDTNIGRYPWDIIRIENNQQPLVLSGAVNLIRYIQFPKKPRDIADIDKLSVLYIESRPTNLQQLPSSEEYDTVRKAFQQLEDEKIVAVEKLVTPTFSSLREKIQTSKITIIHFDGHGIFGRLCPSCRTINYSHHIKCQIKECGYSIDSVHPTGYLAFEKSESDSSADLITSSELSTLLSDTNLQLAIISACHSGEIRGSNIFNSVGPSLVEAGVPAVISMQMPITVNSAVEFMRGFYKALANFKSIEQAIQDGRKYLIRSREWFIPVLYWHSRGGGKPFLRKNSRN